MDHIVALGFECVGIGSARIDRHPIVCLAMKDPDRIGCDEVILLILDDAGRIERNIAAKFFAGRGAV